MAHLPKNGFEHLLILVAWLSCSGLALACAPARAPVARPNAKVAAQGAVAANAATPLPAPVAAPTALRAADSFGLSVVSDVAERTVKSVVNISTTRLVKRRLYNSPEEFYYRQFHGLRLNAEHVEDSLGSGVIVSARGVILTNQHVIDRASTIRVKLSDGREVEARLLGADPQSDVAVLQVPETTKDLQPLALADSDKSRLGEVVLAIGSPFGLAQTVTMGIVSAKGRVDVGQVDYEDFIQTDAAINPGNSGGALVNLRGELIGINTAIASSSGGSQGIGFAIPANIARTVMESLLKNGRISRGWLGIGAQDLDESLRSEFAPGQSYGILVHSLAPGSPAELAGLRPGDVLLKIGEQVMDSTRRLRTIVATHPPQTKLMIELLRDKNLMKLEVSLSEQPTAPLAEVKHGGGLQGLTVGPLSDSLRAKLQLPAHMPGVIVAEVVENTAASQTGLQRGDVLVEINRQVLNNVADFRRALAAAKDHGFLLVMRDGQRAYLAVPMR